MRESKNKLVYKRFFAIFLAFFVGCIFFYFQIETVKIEDKECMKACSPESYALFLVHEKRTCFCDELHGKWRNAEVGKQ